MAPTSQATDVRWLTDDEQAAWRGYIIGTRRLFERLDAELKEHGLNHDDYSVLVALSEAPDRQMRMADLADTAVESRSRLTHHISRLEKRGLVERTTCDTDRRGSFAVITEAGMEAMRAVAPHHVAGVRRHLLDHLSAAELRTIGDALGRVDAALRDED